MLGRAWGILDNLNNIEDCGSHYYIPDPEDGEGVADCLRALPEHLHEQFKALVKEHGGDTICIGL